MYVKHVTCNWARACVYRHCSNHPYVVPGHSVTNAVPTHMIAYIADEVHLEILHTRD